MVRSLPTNEATKSVVRSGEQLLRGGVLLEVAALAHHRDAVAESHRLVDVVRHEHDGLAHRLLQPEELLLQPVARDRVDRAERLVHEQHGRIGRQRTRDAHPLALTAGELVRIAVAVDGGVESHETEEVVDARGGPRLAPPEQLGHGARRCDARSGAGTGPTCWMT